MPLLTGGKLDMLGGEELDHVGPACRRSNAAGVTGGTAGARPKARPEGDGATEQENAS